MNWLIYSKSDDSIEGSSRINKKWFPIKDHSLETYFYTFEYPVILCSHIVGIASIEIIIFKIFAIYSSELIYTYLYIIATE